MIQRFVFLTFLLILVAQVAHSSAVVNAKKDRMRQMQVQQQKMQHDAIQNQSLQNSQFNVPEKVEPKVEEVVVMQSIWKELEFSSEVWTLMIDNEPKVITVENYIKLYAKKGIVIRRDPQVYVDMIDEMAINNKNILKNPFFEVLRFAAIVEYDFDNGVDRDVLAKQLLGEQVYRSNRQRLGLE